MDNDFERILSGGTVVEVATALVAEPGLANERLADGFWPLEVVLRQADVAKAAALLRSGADVFLPEHGCELALVTNVWLEACHEAEPARLRTLLAAGLDSDLVLYDGHVTMLMSAAFASLAVVRLILTYHPEVDAQDERGWTPLMFAAATDSSSYKMEEGPTIVKELLNYGANVLLRSSAGLTARMIAERQDYACPELEQIKSILQDAERGIGGGRS